MKNAKITNIARSSQKYRYLRRKIYTASLSGSRINLNSYLTKSLLKLDESQFATFTFDEADWKLLAKPLPKDQSFLSNDYLALWIDYVVENKSWLNELSIFSDTIDFCALTDDSDRVFEAVKELSIESSQSLYAIKTVSVTGVNAPDYVSSYLKSNLKSPWLREVFADGLMASSATTISNSNFQDAADFMLSNLKWRPERQVIRYLLRPELSADSRVLRSYVALLSHPFDALQLLLVELENLWANGETIQISILNKLSGLSALDGNVGIRFRNLLKILEGSKLDLEKRVDPVAEFFREATSSQPMSTSPIALKSSGLAEALQHCTTNIIPKPEMWERLNIFSIHWPFSEVGKLVRTFLHILYLTSRERQSSEMVMNIWALNLRGEIDEIIASAPSGLAFLRRILPNTNFDTAVSLAQKNIQEPAAYQSRYQLPAIHWRLQLLELDVRPAAWMSYARNNIPIRPEYLSGLNWTWLDKINDSYRVGHFSKDEDTRLSYVYCFLIALSEDHNRDPVAIRTMVKKMEMENLEMLLSYILDRGGEDFVAALVRYYLNTSEILHLKYATNPAAANLQRIYSLDFINRHCPEQKIISKDYYEAETTVLQKSLFSQEINRGQFEFPWHRIKADARSDYKEYFQTAQNLLRTGEGKKVLGEAISSLDHTFRNKQAASYRVRNYLRQIAAVILSIVDELLKQPAFGLEAILSSRFRHDTLERVFRSNATELITTDAIRLPVNIKKEMHAHFWPLVSEALNGWVSTKIHSRRKSTPDGMFNLVPSQAELDRMLACVIELNEFDDAFTVVQTWMINTLSDQLKAVRISFEGELRESLIARIGLAVTTIPHNAKYNEVDTKDYRSALTAAVDHCIADTVSWFSIPEQEAQGGFALSEAIEVAKQICDVKTNEFFTSFSDIKEMPADMRKSALYTFVDAFANVQRHASNQRVRVSRCSDYAVFSNLAVNTCGTEIWDRNIGADNHDALFSEGDSGLVKIAAGMFALRGKAGTIRAIRRPDYFHLILPLGGLTEK